MATVKSMGRRAFDNRIDWGARRVRMVSRYDRPTNWLRRGRPSRESHAWHHMKTKRMEH